MVKSDERLREMGISEHSLFESLLERSPDKIYFKDADSRFVMVSRSMVRNFNVRRASDLLGEVASFTGKTPRVDDQTCLVFQVR